MSAVLNFVPRPVAEMRAQALESVRAELVEDMKRAIQDDRARVPSYSLAASGRFVEQLISANHAIKDALEHLTATGALRDLLANNSGTPDAERIQRLRDAIVEGYADLNAPEIYKARANAS